METQVQELGDLHGSLHEYAAQALVESMFHKPPLLCRSCSMPITTGLCPFRAMLCPRLCLRLRGCNINDWLCDVLSIFLYPCRFGIHSFVSV